MRSRQLISQLITGKVSWSTKRVANFESYWIKFDTESSEVICDEEYVDISTKHVPYYYAELRSTFFWGGAKRSSNFFCERQAHFVWNK